MIHAMRIMMAERMRDDGRSEYGDVGVQRCCREEPARGRTQSCTIGSCTGNARGSGAIGETPRGAVPTRVRETLAAATGGIGQSEPGSAESNVAVGKTP